MGYVEVNAMEAFKAYADGKRVVCLERDADIKGTINAFTLESMFEGFAFLVDVPDPADMPAEDTIESADAVPPLRPKVIPRRIPQNP